MDGLLSIVIPIAIVIYILSSLANKAKEKQEQAAKQARAQQAQQAQAFRETPAHKDAPSLSKPTEFRYYAPEASPAPIAQASPSVPETPRPRVGTFSAGRPDSTPEGRSTMMPRIAPSAHFQGLNNTEASPGKPAIAEEPAGSPSRRAEAMTAKQLRQAVILKEILDAPKGRRHGYGAR